MNRRIVPVSLTLWWLLAGVFVALGGLELAPPPFPQLVLLGQVVALVLAYSLVRRFREFANRIRPSAVLVLHTPRMVGIWFLILHGRGELPWNFAVIGGVGDIVVALWAAVLLIGNRGAIEVGSRPLQIWNVVGLLDILSVIGMAARNAFDDPQSMAPIVEWPLGLLPAVLVPWIVATHLLLIVREWQWLRSGATTDSPPAATNSERARPR